MTEPTKDELNAGFDAAYADLIKWMMDTPEINRNIPFVGNVRDIMLEKIRSPAGRAKLLQLVTDVIKADNAVEAKAKGA